MARNAPRSHLKAVDGLLEPAVAETVEALQIGSADVAVARLALLLARTVDGMDDDQRARMLPQHAGQLLRVLEVLRSSAQPSSAGFSRLQQLREARVG